MPTIDGPGNLNALEFWKSIKAQPGTDSDTDTSDFSGFPETYTSGSGTSQGVQIVLLVMTGFFVVSIIGCIIVFRNVVRRRARKHVETVTLGEVEVQAEMTMKAWKRKSILESLGFWGKSEMKTGKIMDSPSSPPSRAGSSSASPETVLRSPEPRYGYSKVSTVLEPTSASPPSEDSKSRIPDINISSHDRNSSILASESDISILPQVALSTGEGQDLAQGSAQETAATPEDPDTSTSSSFFSDEMIEEMSSIAADLTSGRFSFTKSIDVEVKSVDSRRSSVRIVKFEHERQPVACAAETIEVRAGEGNLKVSDTLEDILSELEEMVCRKSHEEVSFLSLGSRSSAALRHSVSSPSSSSARIFLAEDKKNAKQEDTSPGVVVSEKEENDESESIIISSRSFLTTETSTGSGDTTLGSEVAHLAFPRKESVETATFVVDAGF